jgi:hypothetical protein
MKIQTITITNTDDSTTDYVIIDKGNGEFTSMTKEYYDSIQAPTVIDPDTAK